jgi:hypothetical protein
MLELRCSTHPTYRGLKEPKVICVDCYRLYRKQRALKNRRGLDKL